MACLGVWNGLLQTLIHLCLNNFEAAINTATYPSYQSPLFLLIFLDRSS